MPDERHHTSLPFWTVDHDLWVQNAHQIGTAVPSVAGAPRPRSLVYEAVIAAAGRCGALSGPGRLSVTASRSLSAHDDDQPTTRLVVHLADGRRIRTQTSVLGYYEPTDDDPVEIARDIVFTVALSATLALVDHSSEALRAYHEYVVEPQLMGLDQDALDALTFPVPLNHRKFEVDADTMNSLLREGLSSGLVTLPATVKTIELRDNAKSSLGVCVFVNDTIPDIETISVLALASDLRPAKGTPPDDLLRVALRQFVEWFNAEAWHQHAVLPRKRVTTPQER